MPDLRSDALRQRGPGAGLFTAERIALAGAVRELPGEWFTSEHEDKEQVITLVLPRDDGDKRLPLFLLWRSASGTLHLCMGLGPEAVTVGCYTYITDLTASLEREVRRCLATLPSRERAC